MRDNTQTLKWHNSWQYKGSIKGDEELRTGRYKKQIFDIHRYLFLIIIQK